MTSLKGFLGVRVKLLILKDKIGVYAFGLVPPIGDGGTEGHEKAARPKFLKR